MTTAARGKWQTMGVVALTSLLVAGLTPIVNESAQAFLRAVRPAPLYVYWMIPLPNTGPWPTDLGATWSSLPGAALLAGILCYCLRRRQMTWKRRVVWGSIGGAFSTWLNVPLTALVAGCVYHHLGYGGGLWMILHMEREMWTQAPILIPWTLLVFACQGALLGFWVGALSQLGLPRDQVTAPAPPRAGSAHP